MKIALVSSHSFVNQGGVKNHILELYSHIKQKGHECKIIIPRRSKKERYKEDIVFLGRSWQLNTAGTQGDFCLVSRSKVQTLFNRERFDIIHFHNFILPYSSIMLGCSKATNIVTVHSNMEALPFSRSMPFLIDSVAARYVPKMHGALGVANFNLDTFKNFDLPKKVIPNGINLNEFKPGNPKINKFIDGKINILFVGRMEERKGLQYLLNSFHELRKTYNNIRLIIVGDGILKEQYKDFCSKNKVQDVCFEGSKKDVKKHFASCDIFCSPAIYGESFGIVLLEAMASGKPVVCYGNIGYKSVLDGTKGAEFMIPPRDQDALTDKLSVLIESEKKRKEMSEWGLEEVKKYSWDVVADEIISFYNLCLEKRSRSI